MRIETGTEWISASFNQLESYKKNYLRGKERIAELNFSKKLLKRSRQAWHPDYGKAYLTKYSIETAALETFDDRDILDWEALQQTPEYTHFYHFLKGSLLKWMLMGCRRNTEVFCKAFRNGKQGDIEQGSERHRRSFPRCDCCRRWWFNKKQDSEII